MIRPHPPRFLLKRRKTVSVTPAGGGRTVAGAISTFPIFKAVGKARVSVGTGVSPVRPAAASVLSQNFCTSVFYVLSSRAEMCDNPRCSLPMNKIREILLTEYIGAIIVALLVSDAIVALVTL